MDDGNWGQRGILKLDESCISNPKSEIANRTVQFAISDFGFEMQDSSNFEIPPLPPVPVIEQALPYFPTR